MIDVTTIPDAKSVLLPQLVLRPLFHIKFLVILSSSCFLFILRARCL